MLPPPEQRYREKKVNYFVQQRLGNDPLGVVYEYMSRTLKPDEIALKQSAITTQHNGTEKRE